MSSLIVNSSARGTRVVRNVRLQRRVLAWLAQFVARPRVPAYRRLGSFDLARSALARAAVERGER